MNFSSSFEVAEVELVYKRPFNPMERPLLNSSRSVYELLLQHWDLNKIAFIEQFKVILLSPAKRLLAIYEMSTGGLTATVVDIRLVITSALMTNATAIILSHNHPSGRVEPSIADKIITENLKKAAKLFDIALEDHLIVSPDSFYSFSDNGLL